MHAEVCSAFTELSWGEVEKKIKVSCMQDLNKLDHLNRGKVYMCIPQRNQVDTLYNGIRGKSPFRDRNIGGKLRVGDMEYVCGEAG